MTDNSTLSFRRRQRVAAWLVHLFTASGAVLGLSALYATHRGEYMMTFWLLAAAILVDAVDGVLARWAKTKVIAPTVDGALLDNIIDYGNYAMVPAFFLIVNEAMLPNGWRFISASLIVLVSAYQFTQPEAKTDDHFFKGFPSYWNIIVFYLFIWQISPLFNLLAIIVLAILSFIPIKYVYPSRLDYLSPNRWVRTGMFLATLLWGVATVILMWIYPETNLLLVGLSVGYILLYTLMSVYRTIQPVQVQT